MAPSQPFRRLLGPAALLGVALFAASACSNGEEEARRYEEAQRSFDRAAVARATEWAGSVATAYLDRLAVGDEAPSGEVLNQFRPEVTRLNRFFCEELEALGKLAKEGSGDLEARRVDQARITTSQTVWDAMASALLQGALAKPPDQRDRLLAGLKVEAEADDGTKLEGVAALQDAGLVDADGHFSLPEPDTAEHVRYVDWASEEARRFASRVDSLTEPTRMRIEECLPSP